MQQQPAINADSFIFIKLQLYKMFSLLHSLGYAMCSVCASTVAFSALFIMGRLVALDWGVECLENKRNE